MRNIFIISLFSLYTLISTHLIELIKLPKMYEHYLDHKSDDHSIDFTTFLKIHYSSSKEAFNNDHEDLPFKSIKAINIFSQVIIPDPYLINIISYSDLLFLERISQYSPKYSFSYLDAIWQPPRG